MEYRELVRSGLRENAGASKIHLTTDEVAQIDRALDAMPMSEVFGGSKIVKPN